MKQAKYVGGRGRYHGRRGPSGHHYQFRRDRWTDVPDDDDAAHFAEEGCLEVRTKPATQTARETAESAGAAVSGFLAAVKKASGVESLLESMEYDDKHAAADDLGLDVAGNASHDDLNDAIQSEVDRLADNGDLEL